ncbi:enoyl-CoA hydratase [Candidatus Desantisbacteria bacterium CG07_land_8_20_14_0_80_39_15]|uniref:Enoyl-CoA hydratase n=1 Tax=Candidatus Desantisbacteria bacterium CG07_land_8_20_14_0_80_39_15 TaxID=1974549 RepID=A0A2M6ZEW8_9BACT|nr:MAG: enoyl-CoA hydratase [Candidatus Desantisbacteria bacterium CG07_land_8_20_14_0_80_39_15]
MNFETISVEKKGAIELLTLNRPTCLNAINFTMRDEFRNYLKEKLDDLDTRVIVLTGAGKGFCSGLDIKDPAIVAPEGGYSPKKAYEKQRLFSDFIVLMRQIPQPIIGAINGVAVGAGFSIAMACDIRLAVPKTRFQAAYINLGFGGADMGSSWLLPRIVGTGNASRYLLTGDFLSAEEALRIGFVQAIMDEEKLMDEAMKLAKNMEGKSPLGLRLTKEALNRNTGGLGLEDAINIEDRNQALTIVQLSIQMQESK